MELIKGADTARELTARAKEIAGSLPRRPKLVTIRFGEDGSDIAYESSAGKRMVYPADTDPELFFEAFSKVNADPDVDGILVFQPLPPSISAVRLFSEMDPDKDMDCAVPENRLKLFEGRDGVCPCTPEAVMWMIEHAGIELQGRRAVVVGRSLVVGKPLSMMLLKKNATVTVCHSRTKDLAKVCREADVLVAAVGRAKLIDGSFVKEGAAVFDVGINMDADGKLVGDCDISGMEHASYVTPVPGGVGSVTTSVLALHTAEAAAKKLL